MTMNVSLQQLKVFIAVARARSFTRAAREFGLTQSAVSRCVRELEEAVELKLFDRTTRQVELTLAGSGFERRIGRLLDEIDEALHEGRNAYDAHTGVVVVASNPVLSSGWVPAALARCAGAYPSLTLQLQDLPQAAVLQAVEQGEVDFGIVAETVPFACGNLDVQPLAATPLAAVLPAHHPLAQRATLCWADLADVPLITLNRDAGCRNAVTRGLATHRPDGRPLQELAHVAGVLRMAELGLGVGILPVSPIDVPQTPWCHWPIPEPPLVARVLQPAVLVTTMLVRRRSRSLRPCAQAAWTQFVADGSRGASSSMPVEVYEDGMHEPETEVYAQSGDRMTGT